MANNQRGVTLIELMVAVAVLAILLAVAIPSFMDFKQRSALRGAADQAAVFWGDARFEALRRDKLVKVVFRNVSGNFCLGAAETDSVDDNTACDCTLAPGATGACGVASYPASQREWRGVRVASAATLGSSSGVVVINPKRAGLTDPDMAGRIFLRAPEGPRDYRLNLVIDRNGRLFQCEPADAPDKLSDYTNRRC